MTQFIEVNKINALGSTMVNLSLIVSVEGHQVIQDNQRFFGKGSTICLLSGHEIQVIQDKIKVMDLITEAEQEQPYRTK